MYSGWRKSRRIASIMTSPNSQTRSRVSTFRRGSVARLRHLFVFPIRNVFFPIHGGEMPPLDAETVEIVVSHCQLQKRQVLFHEWIPPVIAQRCLGRVCGEFRRPAGVLGPVDADAGV